MALLVVFFFGSEETDSEALPVEEDFLDAVFPVEGEAVFFLTAFFGSDAFSPDGVSAGFFLVDAFLVEVFFPVSDETVFAVFLAEADTAFAFVPDEETEDDAFVVFLAGAFFSVFVADAFFPAEDFFATVFVSAPDGVFAFADGVFFFVAGVFLAAVFSPDAEGDVFLLLSVFDVAFTDVFSAAEAFLPDEGTDAFFLVAAFAFAGVFPAFADDPAFFVEGASEDDFRASVVSCSSSL